MGRVQGARGEIAGVLDDWHDAASAADGERYFGHMTEDAVFLGTDAGERWDRDAFRAFADPYFSKGRGWTYVPIERHIMLAADGRTAWFDERLENEKLGECRGSGVLVLGDGVWRISHYVLSIPIPNELADEVTQRIREAR